MRLIDADKLIDDIDEEIEYGTERIEKHFGDEDKYITKGLRIARKDILMQPTIDAAPIKHGIWENKGFEKSICLECGARMDGDENEQEKED